MDKNKKPKFGIWYRVGTMALASLGMIYSDYALSQTVGTIEPRSSSTRRNISPATIPDAGGVVSGFYPSLSVSVARQKNVLRTGGEQESDTVVTVSPSILYGLETGSLDLRVQYRTDMYAFSKFSNEDSNNHQIDGNLILDLTNKIDVVLGVSYIKGSEFRGQLGSRLFVGDTPDKFNETAYDMGVIVGRRENTLQLAVKAGASNIRFTNNGQQTRDRDSAYVQGSVFYNIGAVTSLNLNATQTNVDYLGVGAQGNLDSTETRIGLGAQWAPTEATRFKVDVGNTKRKFDDPSQSNFSGVTYAGRVIWQPVEYSTISIFGSRSVEETTDLQSSYIEGDLYGIDWRHALTDIWTVNAYYEQGTDDFNIGRRDQVTEFGGGLFYNWFNWLSIGVQYANTKRDSSLDAADFNDEVVYLTFTTNFNVGG